MISSFKKSSQNNKHKTKRVMNGEKIEEKIKWLFRVNKEHSTEFVRTRPSRLRYRADHPTEICAFKCMDGRIHIPLVTETPLGIIKPYRNIGGYFDLGWPLLGEDLVNWVKYAIAKGRQCLILVTYHYSQGDTHRGCAGFHYDREAAFNFTIEFHKQLHRLFGDDQMIFPLVVGLETDTDSLFFHPENPVNKQIINCSELRDSSDDDLSEVISKLYPSMNIRFRQDLLPLIKGNISHIKKVEASNRELTDMQHREWILGVGRGFDWLHEPNTAIIVGPFSPDLSSPIKKAIGIIADNMKSGRISDDGFLVLSSAPYREAGVDENRAIEKANFFRRYVQEIIKSDFPELINKVRFVAIVIDEHTRKATQIKRKL